MDDVFMEHTQSEAPDAIERGASATVMHDVSGHLSRVASLVAQAHESLRSSAEVDPKTQRVIEELSCLVGETIQLTRGEDCDDSAGTFQPAAYVAGHTAALAGLLKKPKRFAITLHPDCTSARIKMHRADLMRVLTGLLRSTDQWSDGNEPIELDLDIVDSSHPLAARGRTLPAGRYFSFRVTGRSLAATTRTGRTNPGIDLVRASRLVTEGHGGLRYHQASDGRTTREAVIPLHSSHRTQDDSPPSRGGKCNLNQRLV